MDSVESDIDAYSIEITHLSLFLLGFMFHRQAELFMSFLRV